MSKKEPKFETSFKRLEEIVGELERGDLNLEKSLEIFEEGIKISRFCSLKLDEAEKRIEILLQGKDGELKAVPWEEKENFLSKKKESPLATEIFEVVAEEKENSEEKDSSREDSLEETEKLPNGNGGKLF